MESELPQGMEGDCADQFIPEDVLATRMSGPEGQKVQQVLIQWADRTVDEATWEDILTIKSQFPEFNLEDKVAVLGGSVVRDHIMQMGQGWKCQITVGLVEPRLDWFILEGEEHQISRDWI